MKPVQYLSGDAHDAAVPEGQVLAHNNVRPARQLGTRGFRAWLEDVDGGNPRRVLCGCDWAPALAPHYRIERVYHETTEGEAA